MATNVTLKRVNNTSGSTDDLHPTTDWAQVESKPSTFTPTSHSHGNITNGGAITASATIATGDHLVIADHSSGNDLTTSSITFDTTATTQFLRRDGVWTSVDAGNQFVNITGDTMTGTLEFTTSTTPIKLQQDHFVYRRIDATTEAVTGQSQAYILLCRNAGGNDVNGTITMDRTSGLRHASFVDILISSGSSSNPVGTMRSMSTAGSGTPNYKLVTLTYSSNSYVALSIGNPDGYYDTSGMYFTGRIKTTDTSNEFLMLPSSSVTNVADFGTNESHQINGDKIWHAANDGSGSGLDADLLDGKHASDFVAVTGDTMTGNLTISKDNPVIILKDTGETNDTDQVGYISFKDSANVEKAWVGFGSSGNTDFSISNEYNGDINLIGGNVGIGTTSPSEKLEVSGNIRATSSLLAGANLYLNDDNTAADTSIWFGDAASDTAHRLFFDDSDQEFRFSNSLNITGNVRSTGWMWASGNFHTNGNLYLNYDNSPAGVDSYIYFGDDASDTAHYLTFDNSAQFFTFSNAVYAIGNIFADNHLYAKGNLLLNYDNTAADSLIYFGDAASDTAHYLQFSNATQKFTLSDDLIVTGDVTVNGSFTMVDTNTSTTEQWSVTNDGTGPAVIINQTGSQPIMDVQDDGVSALYIADGGNVGIGDTTPTYKLEVAGDMAVNKIWDRNNGAYYLDPSLTSNLNAVDANLFEASSASSRDKFRVYPSSAYAIGMQSAVTYGGLNDWAMTFQFNNDNDRGFWWGDEAHSQSQGAMALTTNGLLTVASGARIGYGELDTTAPVSGVINLKTNGSVPDSTTATYEKGLTIVGGNQRLNIDVSNVTNGGAYIQSRHESTSFPTSEYTLALNPQGGNVTINGNTAWHSGNDGSGSGLDADKLDNIQASSFLRSDANDTYTGTLTLGTNTAIRLPNSGANGIETSDGHRVINSQDSTLRIGDTGKHNIVRLHGQGSDDFKVYYNSTDYDIYHEGNLDGKIPVYDGVFSGQALNDKDESIMWSTGYSSGGSGQPTNWVTVFNVPGPGAIRGFQVASYFGNSNQFYMRSQYDGGSGSWNSWERLFTDGYHPNADKWTTARTITLGGDLTGNVSIDGSANVTLSAQVANNSHSHSISNVSGLQTALDDKAEVTYTSGGTTSDVSTLNFSLSGSTLTITTS